MPSPCSSLTIFPHQRASLHPPSFPLAHQSAFTRGPSLVVSSFPPTQAVAALCTLHPRALAPGVQRTWDTMFTICYQLEVINPCLPVQGMGGWFIYLYNSLAGILNLLWNFAAFGTTTKIKTFSNIRRYKTTAVQISSKSDKVERRLFSHNKNTMHTKLDKRICRLPCHSEKV